MPSLKDIRQKIKGVSTTQQITRAMKMMSAARLTKAIETMKLTESYISKYEQILCDIKHELPNFTHPFLLQRPVNCSLFVIIGGERSLCGGFNIDLNRFALKTVKNCKSPDKKIIAVLPKVIRFFQHLNIKLYAAFSSLSLKTLNTELFKLTEMILKLYTDKAIDEVFVIYSGFSSPAKKQLTNRRILPFDIDLVGSYKAPARSVAFDLYPSPKEIFEQLIPRYLHYLLFRAVVESSAAEQSARRTAMTSATDRAQEIIDDLTLDLNRSRQALITTEIAEIMSGSQVQ